MSRTTVTGSVASSEPAPARRAPMRRILPAQHPAPPRRVSRHLTGWAFAGPATLIVVGLSIFPALWAFLISRRNWDGITPSTPAAWSNYERMVDDPQLRQAVAHTLVFTAIFVPGLDHARDADRHRAEPADPVHRLLSDRDLRAVRRQSPRRPASSPTTCSHPQFGIANAALRVARPARAAVPGERTARRC